VRHVEAGTPVREAALKGSAEIGFTIVSMTISLAAVFIPVLFMGGVVGRLFNEFAVTIMTAILISGFVSLSLTPMLASLMLKQGVHGAKASHGRFYNATERAFDAMLGFYRATLTWTMRHRRVTLGFSLLLLGLTGFLFVHIPKGFIPSEDIGQLSGVTEAEQGISIEYMREHQARVADIIAADPNVESFMSLVGAGGPNAAGNSGRLTIRLKPRHERKLSADETLVLDATAHHLKFIGFQEMYFENSFPAEFGVTPKPELANRPELIITQGDKDTMSEKDYVVQAAGNVVARLGLAKK